MSSGLEVSEVLSLFPGHHLQLKYSLDMKDGQERLLKDVRGAKMDGFKCRIVCGARDTGAAASVSDRVHITQSNNSGQ